MAHCADFENVVYEFISKIAIMPTRALGLTKKAVNNSLNNDLKSQLKLEELLQTEAGETNDFKEGVNAFLEKRKPIFKGN